MKNIEPMTPVPVAVLFMVSALAAGAVPSTNVPLGHADFWPSREQPVGWRGNLLGRFPAATPVTDWDTGIEPLGEGADPKAPRPTKNILWKVPMPNWASCGCIVTGNPELNGGRRIVVTRASPSTVLAYDAETGRKLWHNASDIFDYHFPKDPAKAKELRTLWSKIERQTGLGIGTQGKPRVRAWTREEKAEFERLTDELIKEHPEYFGSNARQVFDAEMKKRVKVDDLESKSDGENDEKEYAIQGIRCRIGIEPFFSMGVALNKYINCYEAGIATPVSDGRYVWVSDAYNLVTCYDLKDGSIKWQKWTGHNRSMTVMAALGIAYFYDEYWPSPWLFAGKVFVFGNWYLHAFDPDSGERLYSIDIGPSAREVKNGRSWPGETRKYDNIVTGWGHDHAVNCAFMTLGDTPVVLIPCGWAVRASDGKVLSNDIGTAMMGSGSAQLMWDDDRDLVFSHHHMGNGAAGEPGEAGFKVLHLGLTADGTLKTEDVLFLGVNSGYKKANLGWGCGAPVLVGDKLHFGGNSVFDVTANRKRTTVGFGWGGAMYQSEVAPGNMVWRFGEYFADNNCVRYGQGGAMELSADGMMKRGFGIPPLAEPVEPLQPQDGNCSPFSKIPFLMEEPAGAPVRQWAAQAVKEGVIRWLNPPPVDPCWLNVSYGAPPFFQGDRFCHRSRAFLYCVGPAIRGVPTDDAVVVAAIRAATDVAAIGKHLDSPSAQYRLEALRRMGALKSQMSEVVASKLRTMAEADPYEEIRAQAIRLLNAADPKGEAGLEAIRRKVTIHGKWWATFPHTRARRTATECHWALNTFKALGEEGDAWLAAVISSPDESPDLRIGALVGALEAERRTDKIKFACMDIITNKLQTVKLPHEKSGWFKVAAVQTVATLWCDDPAAVDFMLAEVLGPYGDILFDAVADLIRPPLAGKFWRESALRCADEKKDPLYVARAMEFGDDPKSLIVEMKGKAMAGDALRCHVLNHIEEPDRTAFVKELLQKAPTASKRQTLALVGWWASYDEYDVKPLEAELKELTKDKDARVKELSSEMVKRMDPKWGAAARDELEDLGKKTSGADAVPEL